VCNILGRVVGIKLKVLENVESAIDLKQKSITYISLSEGRICNISGAINEIWLKLFGNTDGYVEKSTNNS